MGDQNKNAVGGEKVDVLSKKSIDDVFKLLENQNNKMDNVFAEQRQLLNGFINQLKSIIELQSTSSDQSCQALNKASKNQIAIERINQKLLKNFVDICGIPYYKDENIIEIIRLISDNIGLAITQMDISTCYRLGHITRVNVKGEPLPPVIVVEFVRESTKISLLNAMKNLGKDLTSANIGIKNHPPSKIYINERLTPFYREVKREALKFKANKVLKFVWTKGGLIHGRVGDATPVLSFDSVNDIYFKLRVNSPETNEIVPNTTNPGISGLRLVPSANVNLSAPVCSKSEQKLVSNRKIKLQDGSECKKRGRHAKASKESSREKTIETSDNPEIMCTSSTPTSSSPPYHSTMMTPTAVINASTSFLPIRSEFLSYLAVT